MVGATADYLPVRTKVANSRGVGVDHGAWTSTSRRAASVDALGVVGELAGTICDVLAEDLGVTTKLPPGLEMIISGLNSPFRFFCSKAIPA